MKECRLIVMKGWTDYQIEKFEELLNIGYYNVAWSISKIQMLDRENYLFVLEREKKCE